MENKDAEIAAAAKDWWQHFTTPENLYEGGWKQRNDMVEARKKKLHALLRQVCGGDNDVRRKPQIEVTYHETPNLKIEPLDDALEYDWSDSVDT